MFEKEAEEYAIENWEHYEEGQNDSKALKQAYLAGAELGYNKAFVEADKNLKAIVTDFNKANEWHKQDTDDIYDLISEDWSVRYFICIMKDKSRVTAMGSCDEACNGEVSVNLFFEYNDEKYSIDDIAWWKEIIPPKEIEEND